MNTEKASGNPTDSLLNGIHIESSVITSKEELEDFFGWMIDHGEKL